MSNNDRENREQERRAQLLAHFIGQLEASKILILSTMDALAEAERLARNAGQRSTAETVSSIKHDAYALRDRIVILASEFDT